MNHTRHTVIPCVFLLLEKDSHILLQRRFQTGFQDGNYTFISGHVEANESPTQAICRETKEEAGIIVEPKNLLFEKVIFRHGFDAKKPTTVLGEPERVDFFFSTRIWQGQPHITEPDKCDDLQWFPIDSLPENIFPLIRTFLAERSTESSLMEIGYQ